MSLKRAWRLAMGIGLVAMLSAACGPTLLAVTCRNLGLLWLHQGILSEQPRTVERGLEWLERSADRQESVGALRGLALGDRAVGDAQAAAQAIADAQALAADDPLVLWTAGQLALERGERERAVAYWQRAGAGNYLTLQASAALDAARTDEAQAAVELALAVDDQQAEAWLVLGDLLSSRGEWDQAGEAYRRASELAPDLTPAYLGLARVYGEQGETAQALVVLEEAVRQAPQAIDPYYTAAGLLWAEDCYQEALEWCERGRAAVPDHWVGYFCTGISLRNLGEPAQAIEQFHLAVRHGADGCSMQYWIGLAYGDLGQFEQAVAALQQAQCGEANIPWVRVDLARTYEQMGRPDLALAEYRAILTRYPDDEALQNLAQGEIQRLEGRQPAEP